MSIPPHSAVFYSTNRGHWGWGAPDYVWHEAAQRLLDQCIPVVAVLHPEALARPEVQALVQRDARVFPQPPVAYARGRWSAARRWLEAHRRSSRQLRSCLSQLVRPHFFINQGGSYDILDENFLRPWLDSTEASFDLFAHSNQYGPPPNANQRTAAIGLFARARRCWFNSQWMRELTELQLLHHLPNAGCFPLVIRFPHEQPRPWPVPDPTGALRLAAVCRMDAHHKGLDVLLEALPLLPADLPPWTLDLFGGGPDAQYLQGLAQWLKLGDRVNFHPHTSDIPGIWDRHHLLVLTSRYEGLAVSMLEAMACGRPVLRTPYGGAAEWIVPCETGFICPAPEPGLIAQSLAQAMRAQERWPAMGQTAFTRIRERLPRDPWRLYLEPFNLN